MLRILKVIRKTKGAIDLVSIIVGTVIIGLLGSAVGATIFGIIPWIQDNQAKQKLESVVVVQNVYASNKTYASYQALLDQQLISPMDKMKIGLNSDSTCYVAAITSDTGKQFWLESTSSSTIQQYELGAQSSCTSLPELVGTSPIAGPSPAPTPTTTPTTGTTPQPVSSPSPSNPAQPAVGPGILTLKWNSSLSSCATAMLPLRDGVAVNIDWGDGTVNNGIFTNDPTHNFGVSTGTKTIKITGSFDTWVGSPNSWNPECLLDISQWSNTGTTNLAYGFSAATNLTNVVGIPDTAVNLKGLFYNNTTFNGNVSNWDITGVTDLSYAFSGAKTFNQSLLSWDVSSVKTMSNMFANTNNFNQPLTSWNVSNVIDMSGMFQSATKFNQSITSWKINPSVDLTNFRLNSALSLVNSLLGWLL